MKVTKKPSLAVLIFIGLILGVVVGLLFTGNPDLIDTYILPWGNLYLNLIRFIIVPVVFFSIMGGVVSMNDIRKIGSIGIRAVVFYICTTAVAITIALFVANLFKNSFVILDTTGVEYEVSATPPGFIDTIVDMFPSNAVAPFLNASMLQIIFIALIVGFGVIMAGAKAEPVTNMIEALNEVFMNVMMLIIKLSPIGAFCLISSVVASNGPTVLGNFALVIFVAYLCYAIHMAVVYSFCVKKLGKMSPLKFFKGMMPAMMFAFSSASSMGTLPLNMECCEKLGAKKEVINFTLPLGATINMDGTAIYQGVATIFIASCFGIELTLAQMITVIFTATIASIGTAGLPGGGPIMLLMVLESVGLPVEGIALVVGIDRVFDMGRSVVNITGDAACSMFISNYSPKKIADGG